MINGGVEWVKIFLNVTENAQRDMSKFGIMAPKHMSHGQTHVKCKTDLKMCPIAYRICCTVAYLTMQMYK